MNVSLSIVRLASPVQFSATQSHLRSEMASTGQTLMQLPQRMHWSASIQMYVAASGSLAGHFRPAQRSAVGVEFQTAQPQDAVPRRNLDAPVAVDALVLVDLELVVAQVAAPGVGFGGLGVVAQLHLVAEPALGKRQSGMLRRIDQIVVAEPAGQVGPAPRAGIAAVAVGPSETRRSLRRQACRRRWR